MQKIEAFIRHDRIDEIRAELFEIGLPSMSVVEALGSGRDGGIVEHYRGATQTLFLRPKLKLEMVVADEDVERALEVILRHARTGQTGDGKIFVLPVSRAIRIRTGEDGPFVVDAHEPATA